jgi:uncharacterized pyridoxamine 5'-phosphate oxidase family protein
VGGLLVYKQSVNFKTPKESPFFALTSGREKILEIFVDIIKKLYIFSNRTYSSFKKLQKIPQRRFSFVGEQKLTLRREKRVYKVRNRSLILK